MPLAKSAEVAVEKPITEHPEGLNIFTVEGVPYDVYSFFGSSLDNSAEKDKQKLRDIYDYFKTDRKTLGDVMQDISNLESRLGLGGSVSRLDRVWNWVSLGKKIKDIELRKQALERR